MIRSRRSSMFDETCLPPISEYKIPWKSLTPSQRKRLRENPRLYGLPEYEAMEAARGNLTPADAAARCSNLSNLFRRMYRAGAPMVELHDILKTLIAKKIPFVLTGQHGIGSWTGRPRATHDVDILVKQGRSHARAVKSLKQLYPSLETRIFPGGTGFFAPAESESLIDVIYPHRLDLTATIEYAIWTNEAGLRYRVPTLECALTNKYGAMPNHSRDPGKRGQDMVDFYNMVKHSTDPGRTPIDLDKLGALGESISPSIGRAEILRMVAEAKAGKVPHPNV